MEDIVILHTALFVIKSQKPKISQMQCLVPSCTRHWELIGGSQGFTKASGQSHAATHWYRYHKEHHHEGELILVCSLCQKASDEETEKRCKEQHLKNP
jgi:hypothetical protein